MLVRITEETCFVRTYSYELELPDGTDIVEDLDFDVEDHRDNWKLVHEETVRKNEEITNVEEIS